MLSEITCLLGARGPYSLESKSLPLIRLVLITILCGFVYGFVMGCFGRRVLQALYSGIKVPLLLGFTTLICIPNYYVINALLGLRNDFTAALKGVLAAQASLAVTLGSLSTVMAFIYFSITRYPQATFFNGICFAIAVFAGQITLRRHYGPLIQKNPLHKLALFIWILVYVFTAIQTAWVLRPFIGYHGFSTEFFRDAAWSNAYVKVFEAISKTLSGAY